MDWRSIPVPPKLTERPRDSRGFVVPYTALSLNEGWDFTTLDPRKVQTCVEMGLCGLCGTYLGDEDEVVTFVGGPLSVTNRNFLDPPMHEQCALYALNVCPFLAMPTARYSKAGEGVVNPAVHPDRPEKFGLLSCERGEIAHFTVNGQLAFHIPRDLGNVRVEWWGEPAYNERGRELLPYHEVRHFKSASHTYSDRDEECPLEIELKTEGRHPKDDSTPPGPITCMECNQLVRLERLDAPPTKEA